MSRHANAARFGEGATAGSWYNPPYFPDAAIASEVFAARAAWLHARYPTGKIGIAGTGFGWTQYFLFANHSRQSWGCDINWAITSAKAKLGAWGNNVITADVTNATQMTAFRRLGNTGQAKYDVLFTEDLLPCANDEAEAALMLTRLRAVGTTLVHLITPLGPENDTTDMLWRSYPQWRQIVGPTDVIVSPTLVEVS